MKTFAIFLYVLFLTFANTSMANSSSVPQGGQFVINLRSEPATINPASSTTLAASYIHSYTLDTLLERDADTYEWGPRLAHKWEVAKDGKAFTFYLNKNAVFSDGRPVTAEDVKFSFDMIFDPKFGNAHHRLAWEAMDRAEIIDTHTVKFHAKEKYFRNLMNLGMLMVLPKHIYSNPEKVKNVNKNVYGSGPYIVDTYERTRRMILKRNPKWFGWNEPQFKNWYNFDRIVFRFVSEPTVYLEMLKRGDIDFQTSNSDVMNQNMVGQEFEKKLIKVKSDSLESKPLTFLIWNLKNELFASKNVRLAMAHLMNREEMNKKLLYGEAYLSTGPFHVKSDFAPKDIQPIPYDPSKALKLLAKEGWTDSDKDGYLDKTVNGVKQKFRFIVSYSRKEAEKFFTFYQQDLRKVGIDMQVQQMDWTALEKAMDTFKFDAVATGLQPGLDWDPKFKFHSASYVPGGSNVGGYQNSKVDQWIDEARTTLDRTKRVQILQKVYRQIAEDAPYLFMFDQKYTYYVRSKRLGVPKDSFKYDVGLQYWWATDGAKRNP